MDELNKIVDHLFHLVPEDKEGSLTTPERVRNKKRKVEVNFLILVCRPIDD